MTAKEKSAAKAKRDKVVGERTKDKLALVDVKVGLKADVIVDEVDELTPEQKKRQLELLLTEIENRKKNYSIVDTVMDRIPQQKELLKDILEREDNPDKPRYFLYYGGNGAGKCHRFEDKVLMEDGTWKMAGEICLGDKLMGVDSTARNVMSTLKGNGMMYKVTPESGEPIYVNGEHQLLLIHRRRSKKGIRSTLQKEYSHLSEVVPEGKIIQISVEDYLKKSTKWKAEAYMWRPSIVNYERKHLSVDPYFLGVWLGDGTTENPSITSVDNEIISFVEEYADKLGLKVRKSGITYYLAKNFQSRYGFSGYSHLREIGVLGKKHIPIDYLTSSEEQRLALLAGLIDTDGEYASGKTPRYSITQKSERLARDILQLARSLGFRCSIVKTIKTCTNATRVDYVPGTYFRVSINGDVWRIPVKIERKKYAYGHERRHNKDWLVSKFQVEETEVGDYYGFTLDGDSLYLDENFIVQHNTMSGAYITACLALGLSTKKYGLPFLGWKQNIWILTKSGSNVKSTIEPYLLGANSLTRIPDEDIKTITKDNGILKSITMNNGCKINVLTYDQGRENIQGGTPDWIWLDEEPTNEDVVTEILARTRKAECEMLVTMTPLSGLTRLYEFFFNATSENVKRRSRVYLVSSLDNPFIDKTWTEGLTEDEYRLRVLGSFESPTGLVYSSFHRTRCMKPHFDPKELGEGVKYYRGLDFGVSHPTGVVFLAQDLDDNIYVYDEIYRANTLIEDLANEIKQKSGRVEFEQTIRDSASKREGLELNKYGVRTTPADKYSKGENDMSNRKAGIMLVNQMLKDGKLIISDRCKSLVKEFETHYYKEGGKKDGEVNKINDDLLDALRYVIFTIKKNNVKGKTMSQRELLKQEFRQIEKKTSAKFSNL